ncbi:MAG: hypothetical protein AAFU79_21105 [Myxococcota bacterium]
MPFVRHLIRGTDFRRFIDFVTPAFFEVMPAGGLAKTATRLVRDYSSREAFEGAIEHRRGTLRGQVDLEVRGAEKAPGQYPAGSDLRGANEDARRAVGQATLQLYFHQLFDAEGPTLLDLSLDRFSWNGERAVWTPGRGHFDWPPTFREALVDVYRAFYTEGGGTLVEALKPLHLEPAADVFGEHFGGGDQRAVRFEVSKFIESFHAVFMCCKAHGVRLDPAFLGLGIYLATMYETLETVGLPLDVRGAFEAVHGRRAAA